MSTLQRTQVPGQGTAIPVLTLDANRQGPAAVVTANLHGDETVGIAVVHQLIKELDALLYRGTVHFYPSLNPEGLRRGTRELPVIEADLNRVFPGKSNGDKSERHAWRIWQDIRSRRPELLVDLHTDSAAAIPYAIVDRVIRGRKKSALFDHCRVLAQGSGLTVLAEYPRDMYQRYRLDHSLPGAMVNGLGVPAVTLEVGPRNFISVDAVKTAVQGTIGVLAAAGFLSAAPQVHASRQDGGPWRRASGPTVQAEGIFVPSVSPGQAVQMGAMLGTIRALDGTIRQRMRSPHEGFVVSLMERTWLHPGQACITLGVLDA